MKPQTTSPNFDVANLSADLHFERRLAQSRALSLFRRNASTWELLLLLAAENGVSDDGVYKTLARLETNYLGMSALLKFMRERRDDGILEFAEHEKKNTWRVALSDRVHAELLDALNERNRLILDPTLPRKP